MTPDDIYARHLRLLLLARVPVEMAELIARRCERDREEILRRAKGDA